MTGLLRVRWTLTPITPPEPVLACTGCNCPRPFESSGKFRLNANSKRLDAWLIYRCTHCESTWNRPLFERRTLGDVGPEVLQALTKNDAGLAASTAFDVEGLKRHAQDIEQSTGIRVGKDVLSDEDGPTEVLEISLAVVAATPLRLDRLLASELQLTRARLKELAGQSALCVSQHGPRALRRAVKDGTQVTLTLSGSDADGGIATRARPLPADPASQGG